MKKGQNTNATKKGGSNVVEPIREIADIARIKGMLRDKPMLYAMFVFGVNTNLRSSDLLNLKTAQVKNLHVGMEIVVKEKKTGKVRRITLNESVVDAFDYYMKSSAFKNDEYFFTGRKGPYLPVSLSNRVKEWCRAIGLKGNYASHSLRKTWGYHQRLTFNVSLPVLMECYNHACQKQTLDYLCIQPSEIKDVYNNSL